MQKTDTKLTAQEERKGGKGGQFLVSVANIEFGLIYGAVCTEKEHKYDVCQRFRGLCACSYVELMLE